ncbi:hypothetical protein I5M27_09720 [Adhaeribacter sp. BT258]|uniref:Uncharacterized protein n=1 Tax=Adhaeribacter terrigena TaxID=2793070 RepID=A0ABS1C3Q0_9BACT|nr:hypothetical protein [Adhaeribacter terrigena]MBK0403263.1 hypothetical protein [Adhaeribacter terrigena]
MKKRDPQFNLIPHRFKFIGLALVMLTILFAVGVKANWFEFSLEHKESVKTYILNALILGCLFITLAREKVEDEMTIMQKTKAFAFGFVGAVIMAIIWPLMNLIYTEPLQELTGQGLALIMLFTHIFTYYLQKFTGETA